MSTAKLGRKAEHRDRTLRNLVTTLVLYEKLRTTEAKAKAMIPMAERLLSVARRNDLAARRYAKSLLFDANAVRKLFEDYPQRWGTRTSGFVRATKLAPRPGDGAAMMQLEVLLTPLEEVMQNEAKAAKATKASKKEAPAKAEAETSNETSEEAK